jgi:hypothetical protein
VKFRSPPLAKSLPPRLAQQHSQTEEAHCTPPDENKVEFGVLFSAQGKVSVK